MSAACSVSIGKRYGWAGEAANRVTLPPGFRVPSCKGAETMRSATMVFLMVLLAGPAFCSGSPDEQFYGLGGIQSVSIKGQFLDVDVTGADVGRVDMTLESPDRGPFASRNYRVRHDEIGSHLDVWVETDWPFGGGRGTLRFQVPRGVDLQIETVSGRIAVRQLSGDCALKSVSGRVTADRLRCALRAESVSGALQLTDVSGSFRAKTISGPITGDGVDLQGDSTFSSVSGRVEIRTDSPLDMLRFDVSTVSGRISVGNIGAAKGLRMGFIGPLIRASSVSGSVSFR